MMRNQWFHTFNDLHVKTIWSFCVCDWTGPLVREFCNWLWSKANYPKHNFIIGNIEGTQGSHFVLKTVDISYIYNKTNIGFCEVPFQGGASFWTAK
jgi:hypothetical protein